MQISGVFMKTLKTPEYPSENQWKQSHSEVLSETLSETELSLSEPLRLRRFTLWEF